jgi:hypothetical protein
MRHKVPTYVEDDSDESRMRIAVRFWIVAAGALCAALPVHAQGSEDSLRIYAVNVIKTPPFKPAFIGFGIYLGQGAVISAAHIVGRWPLFTRPRVLVAGLDLPATVIKMGSGNGIDLTLLTVDEARLPIGMRMRRNPLCKTPPIAGEEVFGVIPEKVVPTHILPPRYIRPDLRREFDTLVEGVVTPSGSGIFRASTKCLLGIMSKSLPRFEPQTASGDAASVNGGHAGYFVPAAQILEFLPKDFRF